MDDLIVKKNKQKIFMKIFITGIILFYLIPYAAPKILPNDAGLMFFIINLLIFNSLYIMLSCSVGINMGILKWIMPLCIGILFIPSIFLFYNDSAWIYPIIYIVLGYISALISSVVKKSKGF